MIHREPYNPADPPLDRLTLSAELRDQIVAHLRNALPYEGCGLVAVDPQDGNRAVHFFPGSNSDESPTRFTMDGKEVIDALKTMEREGWRLGAIAHSHPRHPATPSATDRVEALYPAALMMICSFEAEEPELRAWALQGQCEAPAIVLGERPIDVTQ